MKKIIFTLALIAFSFKIFAITISAPTLVSPTDNAINQMPNVLLDWSAVPGAFSYKIQVDTSASFTNPSLYTATLTATNASELLFGKKYSWRVKAIGAGDSSAWSSVRSFTVIPAVNLKLPVNGAKYQLTSVLLQWYGISGVTHYDYQIDTILNFNSTFFTAGTVGGSVTSINLSQILYYGTKYYWKVRARHDADTTLWSSVWSFTTIGSMPSSPDLISPVDLAVNQMPNALLSWTPISGVTSYMIGLDTNYSFSNPAILTTSVSNTSINAQKLLFGEKYYWRVKAINSVDSSYWSLTKSFTVINTIDLISPPDNATGQLLNTSLKWDTVTGITRYDYQIDTTINFNSIYLVFDSVNASVTTVSLNTIIDFGTKYYWRVRARHSADTTLWSPAWSFTTLDTMPNVPNLIFPIDLANNQMPNVLLDWETLSGATSYMIELDTNLLFSYPDTLITLVPNSSVNAQKLFFGNKYYWRVKAINSVDSSDWSLTKSFTVIDTIGLISPLDNATYQLLNTPLKWEGVTGITKYDYQADTTINFNSTVLISDSVNSSVTNINLDTVLDFGTKYYWRVRARHSADTTLWSPAWSFTTLDTMPNFPNLVSPVDSTINQMPNVLLSWTPVSGATSYMIESDTNYSFSNPDTLTSVANTSINAQELLFGEKYYWRAKAINTIDSSNWSLIKSFTVIDTLNQTYPNDSVTDQTLSLILKWDAISGVTYYNCETDTTINFNSSEHKIISVNSNLPEAQAFAVQSLFGTKYYWRVRALHNNDTSAWSKVRSYTTVDKPILAFPYNGANGIMPDALLRCNSITGAINYQFETDTIMSFNSIEHNSLLAYDSLPFVQVSNNELLFGTKYYWRVRAIYSGNFSDWSSIWNFNTIDTVKLISPANGVSLSGATQTFKWTKITGITGYELEIDTTSAFAHPVIYLPVDTAGRLKVYNFTNNTYYWRIRACTSRDTSAWSTRSFTITGVGIESLTLNPTKFSIFPNPAYENVYVKIESDDIAKINVAIVDILGKQIREEVYDVAPGSSLRKLKLEGIANGIYLLKFTDGNNSCIRKLTISR